MILLPPHRRNLWECFIDSKERGYYWFWWAGTREAIDKYPTMCGKAPHYKYHVFHAFWMLCWIKCVCVWYGFNIKYTSDFSGMQILCKSNEVCNCFVLKISKRVFVISDNHIINGHTYLLWHLNGQWNLPILVWVCSYYSHDDSIIGPGIWPPVYVSL